MKTSIEFINHSSVIVSGERISILTDPWFQGDVFHFGWRLLYENSELEILNILEKITHIWISHEHPDHFSVPFFIKYANILKDKSIIILFQETKDKRVVNFFRSYSILFIELEFNKITFLDTDYSVLCIKDGFYDSSLLITNKLEKILNLNDCEILSSAKASKIYAVTGEVDILLSQFSYAAWKGGKSNIKWRKSAAKDKLNAISTQIKVLRPKVFIPIASYIFFSNKNNFYLNDSINEPSDIVHHIKDSFSNLIIMKPGDIFGSKLENYSSIHANEFWKEQYKSIHYKKLNEYQVVNEQILFKSFYNYCERISKNNNILLMRLIRFISPINIFKPVVVNLLDLDKTFYFDYVNKEIYRCNETPMLILNSDSLNFIFNNTFGFDTLTVNGCFEEGMQGGFIEASKSLAVENLNNLGYSIRPSIFFNYKLIGLFIQRLLGVSKKIQSNIV